MGGPQGDLQISLRFRWVLPQEAAGEPKVFLEVSLRAPWGDLKKA